jgi:hypothetical protein
MEKEFVSYEQAVALKELGFDEECLAFYELGNKEVQVVGVSQRYNDPSLLTITDFCAPLKQQVFRWFRENDYINYITYNNWDYMYSFFIDGKHHAFHAVVSNFIYYEEAENACIDKLIKLDKEQVS